MEKIITIYVDTDSMIGFFKDDPAYGTGDKPYPADSFYTVDAPDVYYKGHSILSLKPDCLFRFSLTASKRKKKVIPVDHKAEGDTGEIIMSMISEKIPTLEEWGQIIDLDNTPHDYTIDGNLLIKLDKEGLFSFKTNEKITFHKNLKYSFLFRIDGTKDIGYIDPLISNRSEDTGGNN
jgi:hypothetical protein